MRYFALFLVFALALGFAVPGFAVAEEKEKPAAAPAAVVDTLVVAEDTKTGEIVAVEEVDIYLEKAHENFIKGNTRKAALEIRRAAVKLSRAAAKTSDESKKAMQKSAKELRRLAKNVKDGTVHSADDLKKAIDKAYQKTAATVKKKK